MIGLLARPRAWILGPAAGFIGLGVAAGSAAAQKAQPFAVAVRVGAAMGNVSESGAGLELEPGPVFAVTGEARLGPVGIYAGLSRASYGCRDGFCRDRSATYTSQGVLAGVRWSSGLPWVRAGFAYQYLTIEASGADDAWDPGPGWDLAAGVEVPVGPVRLRPGVGYLRHWVPDNGTAAVFTVEVGVAVRFGG